MVGLRDDHRPAEVALALRALLPEVVAREGVAREQLALGRLLEALLGARMGLHLRHRALYLSRRGLERPADQPSAAAAGGAPSAAGASAAAGASPSLGAS